MRNHHHLSSPTLPAHHSYANLTLPGLPPHGQQRVVLLTLPQNALSSANSLTHLTNTARLPSGPPPACVPSDPPTKGSTNQHASLLKMCFSGGCSTNAEGQEALASCRADRTPALGSVGVYGGEREPCRSHHTAPSKDLRTRMACCNPTPFFMRELRSLTLAPRGTLEGPSDHQRKGGDINKSSCKTILTVLPMRILYIKFGLRVHVIANALVISTIRLLKHK